MRPQQRRCAFLTLDDPTDFVIDDELVFAPMGELGWQVEQVPWRSAARWDDYEAVLIRTPWDYQDDPDAFLEVLEAIDRSSARLENPVEMVRWNLRKTYLADLEARGVRIVPTTWMDAGTLDAAGLRRRLDELAVGGSKSDELIVKPVVSANADHTYRLGRSAPDEVLSVIAGVFERRDAMIQPFLHQVVDEGEISVFYFGGAYSHAILKTPKPEDFRVQEEHGGIIQALEPDAALRRRADLAFAAIRPTPLYGRVDLVRTDDDDFAVMEIELIEPSLYFRMDPGAPERFAKAVDDWFSR